VRGDARSAAAVHDGGGGTVNGDTSREKEAFGATAELRARTAFNRDQPPSPAKDHPESSFAVADDSVRRVSSSISDDGSPHTAASTRLSPIMDRRERSDERECLSRVYL